MNLLLSSLSSILITIPRIDTNHNSELPTLLNVSEPRIIAPLNRMYTDEVLDEKFKKAKRQFILNEHNKYRKLHRVPRLVLNDDVIVIPDELGTLTVEAESWAEDLTYIGVEALHTSMLSLRYGENVFIKPTNSIESFLTEDSNPVKIWYSQKKWYNGYYSEDKNSRAFSQLVWKSSRKLGVGFAYSKSFGWTLYVVCHYYPEGNIIVHDVDTMAIDELFQENVLPSENDTWPKNTHFYFDTGKFYTFLIFFIALAIVRYSYYIIYERVPLHNHDFEEEAN